MAEPAQVSVTFEDIAVYFSEDEWEMLAEWQKELYRETMKENYETLTSLGCSSEKPSLILKIEREEDPCIGDQQDLRDRKRLKGSWEGTTVNMKRAATAGKRKDMKQLRLTNFFTFPLQNEERRSLLECEVGPAEANKSSESRAEVGLIRAIEEVAPSTSQQQRAKGRKFKEEWCKELKWLKFDQSKGIANCEVCVSFPGIADQHSKIVKGFAGPFKLETFKKHEKSIRHQKCVLAYNVLLAPEITPLVVGMEEMDQKLVEHMKALFNVAYYIAKNHQPFSDFEKLLELTGKLGVEVRDEYKSDSRCKEFVSHIAKVIRQELICELQDSEYVSLMLDGSTDKADAEELILYVRYIKNNGVREVLLSVITLDSATADEYLEAIQQELDKHGLLAWLSSSQLVGISTDGAASMIGAENGLIPTIRQNLSHVVVVHSVAHSLSLTVLSAVKNARYIENLDAVLKKLYKFYQYSPKRMRQLKKIAESLESEIQKFQYLHNVRWVVSKVCALSALVKDWKCVIGHLESIAAERDNASALAKGLLRKLTDFAFVHMLHFLLDYLGTIKNLSLLFQREELFLSTVELHVRNTMASLASLKDVPGQHESRFISTTSLKGLYQDVQLHGLHSVARSFAKAEKDNLILHAIKYFEERFIAPHRSIERCTTVFDTFAWPTGTSLDEYGVSEITTLVQHFQNQLSPPGMYNECIQAVHNEWYEFKILGRGKKLGELLNLALTNNERFPFLGKLLSIASVLPVSGVCCERGFSLMNFMKNKCRSSMEAESLNDLVMINMNGPSVMEFDPSKALHQWYFSSKIPGMGTRDRLRNSFEGV